MQRYPITIALVCLMSACGGPSQGSHTAESAKEAEDANQETEPPKDASEDANKELMLDEALSTCHSDGDLCLPARKFVAKLCDDVYPGLALHFFSEKAPFSRGYLTGKVKAWNASGGVSDNEAWLAFDEEVVLLRKRGGPKGGMQVSGAEGGYDAIRWDGSCVTLSTSEVSLQKPPSPKAAKIEWRYLDNDTKEALRKSEDITAAYRARRKECKGAVSGSVSLKCVKADAKLSEVIAERVRAGVELGTPEKVP